MIWATANFNQTTPLADHIRRAMVAAGVPVVLDATAAAGAGTARESACRRADAADAVAEFVHRDHRSGTLSDAYLLMLVARALWAVGDTGSARQLVRNGGRALNLSAHCAEAAFAAEATLSDWADFFSSRAVRPMALRSFGGATLWILDVAKLVPTHNAMLELTMLRALRAVLERLAEVWDTTDGRGLLGLCHLRRAAGMILDAPAGARKSRRLAGEMRADCLAWLRVMGARRHWTVLPTLVSLDFKQ